MAGQVNARHEVQPPGIADHSQGVGYPFMQRMVPEFPAAFTVPVQVKAERSEARLPHGFTRGEGMGLVLRAGKPVKDDHQRAALRLRAFQDGAQTNAVIHNGQAVHFSRFLPCCGPIKTACCVPRPEGRSVRFTKTFPSRFHSSGGCPPACRRQRSARLPPLLRVPCR